MCWSKKKMKGWLRQYPHHPLLPQQLEIRVNWLMCCSKKIQAAPINSCLNVVVRSPTPFGLVQNGCWPSRVSQVPQALPFIFSLCCPLNDRRRAAHSFFKIRRLFSLFFFSCPSSSPHSSPSLDEQ